MKMASREVWKEIRKAKAKYREKIELQYTGSNLQAAWHGIKTMASINQYANDENHFFSRFVNIRKSAGLCAICGRTLRYCAEQLSEAFPKLFQLCAERCQMENLHYCAYCQM